MKIKKTINLSRYEVDGLAKIKEKRPVGESELIREAVRLLMKQEGITIIKAV